MAKQKGIMPLVGTIGGINFYYLNGKPVAREAGGGFNGKAIKTKASMQRVRENGIEFGHCSRANKAFRLALRPFYQGYRFTFFHSRLMRLFTQLKDLDAVNARGARVVGQGAVLDEGQVLITQFDYTPDCDVKHVLPFKFDVDAASYSLTISSFDIKKVGFIHGATHIGLRYGIMDFNFETLDSALFMATPLVLDKGFEEASVILIPEVLPSGIGISLAVLGVRFYQEVDSEFYMLQAKNGVGLVVLKSL